MQLSLENKNVVANIDEYVKTLSAVASGKSDVIGFAFAINGRINSTDVYVSNALFKKVWMKNLKASATEAVAEAKGLSLADPVKADVVKALIDDSERAKSKERRTGPSAKYPYNPDVFVVTSANV